MTITTTIMESILEDAIAYCEQQEGVYSGWPEAEEWRKKAEIYEELLVLLKQDVSAFILHGFKER